MMTFWTACNTCKVLHEFERKYLGNKLVCPGCNKSFKAVEAVMNDGFDEVEEEDETLGDFLLKKKKKKKKKKKNVKKKKGIGKMGCEKGVIFMGDDEVGCEKGESFKVAEAFLIDGSEEDEEEDKTLGDFMLKKKKNMKKKMNGKMGCEKGGVFKGYGAVGCERGEIFKGNGEVGCEKGEIFKGNDEVGCENGENFKGDDEVGIVGRLRKRTRSVGEVLESSEPKRVVGSEEETMTLAQFQSKVKRKFHQEMVKGKEKEEKMKKKLEGSVRRKASRLERHRDTSGGELEAMVVADLDSVKRKGLRSERHMDTTEEELEVMAVADLDSVKRKGLRSERHMDTSGEELEVMAVADSDFYDFDKDRVERSFKKGQVWAVYDGDDDGMPRQYVLIDETVSANPFNVMISWLDFHNNGDGKIVSREKLGFKIPCGRFKVAKKASIGSVNVFSHVVDCDRAAREVYKIYPKKGSVWALYSEASLDADEGNRCYDIVLFLTSYSEMNGISMAYLEKVDGYKTVFKRQESGSHAVRFLGKDEFCLISHQIPARKFPCDEDHELLKDCWELDPASLPSDLLTIGGIDN
ncbi:DUF3444 domain protein [Medicago truncatula]|uniref:DUF3444 domain protein n=2 Tax=Medicago truncatula TaxID=3880 RepID=G7KCA3_MEDTR|nr:DUF3444 domain protein [Medicago truncatula]